MGSKWRKARLALGCITIPKTLDDSPPLNSAGSTTTSGRRFSDAASPTSSTSAVSPSDAPRPSLPLTPTPSSSGLRLSKHSSKSSKNWQIQVSCCTL